MTGTILCTRSIAIVVLAADFLYDFMYAQYSIVVLAVDFLYRLKKNGQKKMTGTILCAVLDCSSSCQFSVRIEKMVRKMTGTISVRL